MNNESLTSSLNTYAGSGTIVALDKMPNSPSFFDLIIPLINLPISDIVQFVLIGCVLFQLRINIKNYMDNKKKEKNKPISALGDNVSNLTSTSGKVRKRGP